MSPCVPLLLGLLLSTHAHLTNALQIGMGFGERKCFSQDVASDRPIQLDFHATGGSTELKLDVFVMDDHGSVVWHKAGVSHHKATVDAPDVRSRRLAGIGPAEPGQGTGAARTFRAYRFCVLHQTLPGQVKTAQVRRVSFDIRSGGDDGSAEGLDKIARVGNVDSAKGKMKRLEEEVMDLVGKMDALREAEYVLTTYNESTSRFLLTVSALTSAVVVAVGTLQLELVHGVLRERKLIR